LSISGRFRWNSDSGIGNKMMVGSMKSGEARIGSGFRGPGLRVCNKTGARDSGLVRE
jgi:hypothetical protein